MTARLSILTVLLYIFLLGARAPTLTNAVALVIGNSNTEHRCGFSIPATTPRTCGFVEVARVRVILRVDADKQGFLQALAEFARAVIGADIGLFFYAGHGMQYNGNNYLMPVGAQLQDESAFALSSLPWMKSAALERSGRREDSRARRLSQQSVAAELTRSIRASNRDAAISRGSRDRAGARTVVAYSTQSNEVAEDGNARNSPSPAHCLTTSASRA